MYRENDEADRLKFEALEREVKELKARVEALEAKLNPQKQHQPPTPRPTYPAANEANTQAIEVVLDPKDPAKGCLLFEVGDTTRAYFRNTLINFQSVLQVFDWNDERGRNKILSAANLVCHLAIRGMNTSYLRDKAQVPPYRNEGVSWKMPHGADSSLVDWLEKASLSVEVAKQILRLSEGQPALTKEEQWN